MSIADLGDAQRVAVRYPDLHPRRRVTEVGNKGVWGRPPRGYRHLNPTRALAMAVAVAKSKS